VQTSPDRDRYADFLRVLSITLVVLGHWLAAVVLVRDGELVTGRLHALVPWTQWATWMFQVMPVFFIVGGFVNARSWSRAARDEHAWSTWTRRRYQRLLVPLFPLAAFWVLLTPVLLAAGLPSEAVQLANQGAFAPIWFLGVYLLVIAFVPVTWMLHRRFGCKAAIAFVLVSAAVDMLVRVGVSVVGFANMLFVWAGIHQIGYFWHDGRLPERAIVGFGLIAIGMATLLALITVGDYAVSMVAADDQVRSNVNPPSVALFALALVQLGLVVVARHRLETWLERPRVWAMVVILGSITLTVYLWHMTAMILVAAITYLSGLWPHSSAVDTRWWLLRLPWSALCVVLLGILVFVFSRFERPMAVSRTAPMHTFLGLIATLAGIALLAQRGLYVSGAPWQVSAAVITVLAAGLAFLGALRLLPPPEGAR
jgi:peptidoglycan/LPS O-acetylase OafA/YrhL